MVVTEDLEEIGDQEVDMVEEEEVMVAVVDDMEIEMVVETEDMEVVEEVGDMEVEDVVEVMETVTETSSEVKIKKTFMVTQYTNILLVF